MPTTDSTPPADLLTTDVPPAADLLTTERTDPEPTTEPDAEPALCNVPGCLAEPVTRGLCEAHWCTHRGLADPEDQTPDPGSEVTVP